MHVHKSLYKRSFLLLSFYCVVQIKNVKQYNTQPVHLPFRNMTTYVGLGTQQQQ
jgi:hypothetical protein